MAEGSKVGVGKELAKIRTAIVTLEGLLPGDQIELSLRGLRAKEAELLSATLVGDGAIAQAAPGGTANAAGKGGLIVRDVYGNVITNPVPEGNTPKPAALEEAYLRHLLGELSGVSLSGIDPAVPSGDPQERLQLEAVYTALLTQTPRSVKPEEREERRSQLSALEVLDRHKRLVLLGDPGSGKSTFASFVGLCLAGELLGLGEANGKVLTIPLPGEEGQQPWGHLSLLPVHIVLRDFAADGVLPAEGEPATANHLWSFIERGLVAANLGDYAPLLRKRLLETGGWVVLDGLDEVPEAERRRAQIREAVESFTHTYSRCRFLVTSRTYAYQNQGWRLAGFEEAVLAPFGSRQIDLFVERWYAHMASLGRLKAEDAAGRAAVLQRAIQASDRLQGLAQRPLLLTLMASLHAWRGGSLPERREELYADAVNLLLDLWERQRLRRDKNGQLKLVQPSLAEWLRTDRDAVRRVLEDLAFESHSAQPAGGEGADGGTADLSEERLVGALMRLARTDRADPVKLVEYLSQRSGLLMARGVGVYTLPHRTFQEYLAACHLTRDTFPVEVAGLARGDPNRWREVLLLAGAKAARGASSNVWSLAEHLCYSEPEEGAPIEDLWGAHLAGQAVVESANLESVAKPHQEKLARLRRWHERLIGEERLPPRERALAGETLAALGDPRFDPERWMLPRGLLLGFVEVPAGAFRMGSDPALKELFWEDESPEHTVDLKSFYIGRWPVTVGQFRVFVATTGYEGVSARALGEGSNRPIRWVSFGDALAYARWLGEELRKEASGKEERAGEGFWGGLASGWLRVTLPSEAEWEKAARGEDGRTYPWGGEFDANLGNSGETGIGGPSSVGCFLGGASPYGAEEMSGNVWEWTRSLWGPDWQEAEFKYPYVASDGREDFASPARRVLRGGAFDGGPGDVRCAVRFRLEPGVRHDFIGFRVVVSPFPL